MKLLQLLLITLTVCISLSSAFPAEAIEPIEFFVATDGADDNSGTATRPFASIYQAQAAVRTARAEHPDQAVTVTIEAGRYELDRTLVFTPEDSGASAEQPVRYRAATAGEVVLSGGVAINNWQPVADQSGLWKTRVAVPMPDDKQAWRFEQLWVNDQRAVRARTPNYWEFNTLLGVSEEPIEGSEGRFTHTFAAKPDDLTSIADLDPAALTDVQVLVFHKWDTTRERLQTATPDRGVFTTEGVIMKHWNTMARDCLYYLENYREALDAPGEWFLDRDGWLYYHPREGEDITTADVIAARTDRLLEFCGETDADGQRVRHISLEGLKLRHAEFRIPPEGLGPWQAAMNVDATAVQLDGVKDIRISDCAVEHIGSTGIWFRKACQNCQVERTRVFDTGIGAVRIGEERLVPEEVRTGHITFDNCILQSGGRITPHTVGLWIGHSADNTITHCDIGDFFYTAISVGWRWGYGESGAKRNCIEYNRLHDLGYRILSDMGGVYTLGPSEGTSVSHNVIHDVYSTRYGGWGLYPDEGSTGIRYENNLVYNVRDGCFHQHYGRENVVQNNIFAFSEEGQIAVTRAEPHLSFTFQRNLIYWDDGHLLGYHGWNNGVKTEMRDNLYWRADGKPFDFNGKSWQQWRESGNDEGSLITDPMFVDAENYDFRLREGSPVAKIGFVPFDYTEAGVYGDDAWRQLAASIELPTPYVVPPTPPLNVDDDFEPNVPVPLRGIATWNDEGRESLFSIVQTPDGKGSCMKVLDAPDLKAAYNPHFYWSPGYTQGRARLSFRIRLEEGTRVSCEWRSKDSPYRTGPSLQFFDQTVSSRGRKLLDLPANSWLDVTMEAPLGESDSRWNASFILPDGTRREVTDLPSDPEWKEARWVGFSSSATNDSAFYLDDVRMEQ